MTILTKDGEGMLHGDVQWDTGRQMKVRVYGADKPRLFTFDATPEEAELLWDSAARVHTILDL